jgi:hypothetical protein
MLIYNRRRIHRSHEYQTPDEIYYFANAGEPLAAHTPLGHAAPWTGPGALTSISARSAALSAISPAAAFLHDLLGACRAGDHATDNRISGKPGDSQLSQLDPSPSATACRWSIASGFFGKKPWMNCIRSKREPVHRLEWGDCASRAVVIRAVDPVLHRPNAARASETRPRSRRKGDGGVAVVDASGLVKGQLKGCDAAKNNWTTPKGRPAAHSAPELVVSIYS